jgi:hypothetical protein
MPIGSPPTATEARGGSVVVPEGVADAIGDDADDEGDAGSGSLLEHAARRLSAPTITTPFTASPAHPVLRKRGGGSAQRARFRKVGTEPTGRRRTLSARTATMTRS